MDLLKNARLGDKNELNSFLKTYAPLAVANEDCSVLLLYRHFKVQYWNDERRVLNCHPEDEHFQCGITIVTSSEDGGSQSNVYLPNNLHYQELKIQDKEIEIITDEKSVMTNVTELFRKLDFWGKFTEQDIEIGFNKLCNEQYEEKKHIKPVVKNKILQLSTIDTLTYNEEYEWYEGNFTDNQRLIEITVHHTTPKKLEKLLQFIDEQMQSKFYEKMLLEMEAEMIELKNDVWIGEDEETGEEEPPMTIENFRKRISISSIVFYDDCSASIYCNDDDIFWGHSIDISVDKNGKYKDVNLAG